MGTVRKRFCDGIELLRQQLSAMATQADEMLGGAVEGLIAGNLEVAETVVERDRDIDVLYRAVEREALLLLATQQPVVGSDLRFVHAALKTITDMERIGDLAVNIARTTQRMADESIAYEHVADLRRFAHVGQWMLRDAIQAMMDHDCALARDVVERDDEADALYRDAQQSLRQAMQETRTGDPKRAVRASYLLFVAHYLERACDHSVNIAERVLYSDATTPVLGERLPHGLEAQIG
jgi:phosphate transport system protein